MNKKISVIMGVYNCENTLSEAIESLLQQTYSEWKAIVCDDGSTDKTYQIANLYQEKYPDRIILIKNDVNKGLNYTLNKCLEYVDTEYIARMDGDDISLPNRFEEEIKFLEKHKEYAIVSSPMIYFDEKGEFKRGKGSGEPQLKSFAKGTPFCHAPCLVRREAYVEVNGYTISKKRLRVEDWDLWIRMYEKGFKGFELTEPLYKMRDDREAYNRRRFLYRINETRVIMSAIKKLNLPVWMYIWSIRPIIVGLLPEKIYRFLHR